MGGGTRYRAGSEENASVDVEIWLMMAAAVGIIGFLASLVWIIAGR